MLQLTKSVAQAAVAPRLGAPTWRSPGDKSSVQHPPPTFRSALRHPQPASRQQERPLVATPIVSRRLARLRCVWRVLQVGRSAEGCRRPTADARLCAAVPPPPPPHRRRCRLHRRSSSLLASPTQHVRLLLHPHLRGEWPQSALHKPAAPPLHCTAPSVKRLRPLRAPPGAAGAGRPGRLPLQGLHRLAGCAGTLHGLWHAGCSSLCAQPDRMASKASSSPTPLPQAAAWAPPRCWRGAPTCRCSPTTGASCAAAPRSCPWVRTWRRLRCCAAVHPLLPGAVRGSC